MDEWGLFCNLPAQYFGTQSDSIDNTITDPIGILTKTMLNIPFNPYGIFYLMNTMERVSVRLGMPKLETHSNLFGFYPKCTHKYIWILNATRYL